MKPMSIAQPPRSGKVAPLAGREGRLPTGDICTRHGVWSQGSAAMTLVNRSTERYPVKENAT